MNGASPCPSLPARRISPFSIATSRATASSRVGLSSAWRQCSMSTTFARDRSAARFWFSSTSPARALVPPMSIDRMLSCPRKIQPGASCTPPSSPASSGSLRIGTSSMSTPSPRSSTCARPTASSPTRLSRRPPPTTTRCVPFQDSSRVNRRSTAANSCAKSSTAVCTIPASSGDPSCSSRSSSDLLMSLLARSPSGRRHAPPTAPARRPARTGTPACWPGRQ